MNYEKWIVKQISRVKKSIVVAKLKMEKEKMLDDTSCAYDSAIYAIRELHNELDIYRICLTVYKSHKNE